MVTIVGVEHLMFHTVYPVRKRARQVHKSTVTRLWQYKIQIRYAKTMPPRRMRDLPNGAPRNNRQNNMWFLTDKKPATVKVFLQMLY